MADAATRQHAHPNTVYHCLYRYYYLGLTRQNLARMYSKSERTISNWIKIYEENGSYGRANTKSDKKFTAAHHEWLVQFYSDRPLVPR